MNEHSFSLESLIGGWYIPNEICDDLIKSLDKYNKPKPFENYLTHLDKCLKEYVKRYEFSAKVSNFFLSKHTNLQKYNPGQGYYKWHFEDNVIGKRHLVFMTYLNDVDDGGTEFKYQNITTPAKKGLTLIWPTHWTHTHRGQVSNTKIKYITTGWFDFYE